MKNQTDHSETVSSKRGRPDAVPNQLPPAQSDLAFFARRMVVALLIIALAYLLWSGIHVLMLAFAGVLFAIFLSALTNWVSQQTKWPRGLSLATVILAHTLLAGGFTWLLGARVAEQAGELVQQLPKSQQQIQKYLNDHPWGRELLEKVPKAAEAFAQPSQLSRVTGVASGAAGCLLSLVVIAFVGIFGAAEPDVYKDGLIHLVPPERRMLLGCARRGLLQFAPGWWARRC